MSALGQNPPPSFVTGAAELASIADAGGDRIRLGAAGRATECLAALATGAVPAGRATSICLWPAAGACRRHEGLAVERLAALAPGLTLAPLATVALPSRPAFSNSPLTPMRDRTGRNTG